jgi:hypothetical protein
MKGARKILKALRDLILTAIITQWRVLNLERCYQLPLPGNLRAVQNHLDGDTEKQQAMDGRSFPIIPTHTTLIKTMAYMK